MTDLLAQLRDALPERYRVDRQIGQGGMATVFVADDTRYGRKVAVKVLNPDLASTIGAERFEREIQVLGKLSHPHILPVLDSGESHGLFYYVMPFVEGESLRDRLNRDGQLPVDEAVAFTCDVADALAHAHRLGIIHRDIKPENVLIHGGHAVVADFGIARLAQDTGGAQPLTMTGMSVGTAAYMSPEQATGDKVDTRSDIYSLGCMLYELLAGEPPFTGPNSMAIMARQTMERPRSIRVVRQGVPLEIEETVLHALEKSPVDRFKTMDEFKQVLLGRASVGAWQPTGSVPVRAIRSVTGPIASIQRPRVLAAVAVLLVVGLVVWKAFGHQSATGVARVAGDFDATHVAVTYFKSDGVDAASLADGLTESLIDNLSTIPTLRIVSRNGVAQLRDSSTEMVARALKVGSIVTGEVSSKAGRVHVDVHLIDAAANSRVGNKGFDVAAAAMGTLRDSISNQVAIFLRQQLGFQVALEERRSQTSDANAWLDLQRGERQRKDADSLRIAGDMAGALSALAKADTFLEAAATDDKRWAEPVALRALVAVQRARVFRNKPTDVRVAIDGGLTHADRALALDARNADALEGRGTLRLLRAQELAMTNETESDRYLKLAETDLRGATEANPAQANAFAVLSQLYYMKQALSAANLAAQSAYRADAYLASAEQILTRLFWTSHDTEEFSEAERWCTEGRQRFPANPFFTQCALWLLTTKYKEPYDPNAAWRQYDVLKKITPPARLAVDTLEDRIIVAMVLAKAADADRASDPGHSTALADSARHLLLRARPSTQLDPHHDLAGYEAVARVFLHDYNDAISLIEQYLGSNPEHARGFKTNTAWWWRDPNLQNHPRFRALIASIR